MNSSELADIASAAAQAPGRLGVCYQNRLNPTSLRIRKELAEGVLGKMLSIKAVLTWSRSGAYYTESPWRGQLATEGGSLLINQSDPYPRSDAVVRGWRHAAEGGSRQRGTG